MLSIHPEVNALFATYCDLIGSPNLPMNEENERH